MAGNLQIFAGKKAYSLIQEQGLRPELVDVIAGAAGGPKWLVLNGLDRAMAPRLRGDDDNLGFIMGVNPLS